MGKVNHSAIKVVQRGASLSYQCDMCLMNIRDYGEQGADSSWCAICKDQWESMYEAYKEMQCNQRCHDFGEI
jgi:hypothetical protein